MLGLTPIEAEVLALITGPQVDSVVADPAQCAAADMLVAAGRARVELALWPMGYVRRLIPTDQGRLALQIYRFLQVGG